MTHFYLTLPSNSSMEYYPSNTLTKYTTKLHNAVSLQGEWEVGLSEIIFPKNWLNVANDQIVSVYILANQYDSGHEFYSEAISRAEPFELLMYHRFVRAVIPKGYYKDVPALVNEINKQLRDALFIFFDAPSFSDDFKHRIGREGFTEFRYDSNTNMVNVHVLSSSELDITPDLVDILGFSRRDFPIETDEDDPTTLKAQRISIVDSSIQTMYVYCDVAECVPVGDTSAPLLRVVDVDSPFRTIVHRNFDRPRYIALRKLNFESLEIDIRDSFGQPIPFESGTVIVTLHFRRTSSSYLLT